VFPLFDHKKRDVCPDRSVVGSGIIDYKSVRGAGTKAKTMTNLPIVRVIGRYLVFYLQIAGLNNNK
jgi:hypothetical protein